MPRKYCYNCKNGSIKNPNESLYICKSCISSRIYKTYALKNFGLNLTDLETIPSGYCNCMSCKGTYYLKNDIINLAINKYGINYEQQLLEEKINKQEKKQIRKNILKQKRILNITKKIEEKGLQCNMDHELIERYISNGKNIRKIMNFLIKEDTNKGLIKNYLEENHINKKKYSSIIDECLSCEISFEKMKDIITRKKYLIKELKKNNLHFRSDSTLYSNYIYDDPDQLELNEIIKIMKEMNILYNKTNYRKILKKQRRKYIQEQRGIFCGYYPYDDLDEEIVREKAKKIALQNIIN